MKMERKNWLFGILMIIVAVLCLISFANAQEITIHPFEAELPAENYQLQINDAVEVVFSVTESLSFVTLVDSAGKIALKGVLAKPEGTSLRVKGKPVVEVISKIKNFYGKSGEKTGVQQKVDVLITTYKSPGVLIFGNVKNAGFIEPTDNLTLKMAINSAERNSIADTGYVIFSRNNDKESYMSNTKNFDIVLMSGDVIYVPSKYNEPDDEFFFLARCLTRASKYWHK